MGDIGTSSVGGKRHDAKMIWKVTRYFGNDGMLYSFATEQELDARIISSPAVP
jgi:hypothetical protein